MATVRIKSNRVSKSKKKVQFKVEVKGELNITEFIACQQVNQYLFTHIGNMLHAGDPDLLVGDGFLQWDVPVVYSLPDLGELGTVGHILVDAQNGDLKLEDSTSKEDLRANGKRLYQKTALQTGV